MDGKVSSLLAGWKIVCYFQAEKGDDAPNISYTELLKLNDFHRIGRL